MKLGKSQTARTTHSKPREEKHRNCPVFLRRQFGIPVGSEKLESEALGGCICLGYSQNQPSTSSLSSTRHLRGQYLTPFDRAWVHFTPCPSSVLLQGFGVSSLLVGIQSHLVGLLLCLPPGCTCDGVKLQVRECERYFGSSFVVAVYSQVDCLHHGHALLPSHCCWWCSCGLPAGKLANLRVLAFLTVCVIWVQTHGGEVPKTRNRPSHPPIIHFPLQGYNTLSYYPHLPNHKKS